MHCIGLKNFSVTLNAVCEACFVLTTYVEPDTSAMPVHSCVTIRRTELTAASPPVPTTTTTTPPTTGVVTIRPTTTTSTHPEMTSDDLTDNAGSSALSAFVIVLVVIVVLLLLVLTSVAVCFALYFYRKHQALNAAPPPPAEAPILPQLKFVPDSNKKRALSSQPIDSARKLSVCRKLFFVRVSH
jgi:hypothetical protein